MFEDKRVLLNPITFNNAPWSGKQWSARVKISLPGAFCQAGESL